jgi:S2P endopeptidase
MFASNAIGLFLGIWSLIWLIDYYFRLRNFRAYVQFAEKTGLQISPFQIRLYTGRFERSLLQWEFLRPPAMKRILDLWFFVGIGAAVLASGFMLYLITSTLYVQLAPCVGACLKWAFGFISIGGGTTTSSGMRSTSDGSVQTTTTATTTTGLSDGASSGGIVPIIPGVNIPWSQLPLLFIVLAFSGIIHELGHALAAINENVSVSNFGVFMFGIYPGAFTELDNDSLESATLFRRLKIYCGGIWHNLFVAFVAVACLSSMPTALGPLGYSHGKGVVVTDVRPESGLATDGGLRTGYVIYAINHCKVFNEDDWIQCLSNLNRQNYGYCVPRAEVNANLATKVINVHGELYCCGDKTNATQSHLCFYSKLTNETTLENIFEYSCLPARYVTDHSICNHSLTCVQQAKTKCVYAALFNSTKLIRFRVANQSKPVLFVGSPGAILSHVSVGSFVPKSRLAPAFVPIWLDLFFRYLFTFSLALGLLNATPCYSLDGQYILGVLTDSLCTRRRSKCATPRRKQLVYKSIMLYGTLTLIGVVVISIIPFLRIWL